MLIHIARTSRPAPEATALVAHCGLVYARRDPATREVWHTAVAANPTTFAQWQATWGQRETVCAACAHSPGLSGSPMSFS